MATKPRRKTVVPQVEQVEQSSTSVTLLRAKGTFEQLKLVTHKIKSCGGYNALALSEEESFDVVGYTHASSNNGVAVGLRVVASVEQLQPLADELIAAGAAVQLEETTAS